MKDVLVREMLWFGLALVLAIPAAYLWLSSLALVWDSARRRKLALLPLFLASKSVT